MRDMPSRLAALWPQSFSQKELILRYPDAMAALHQLEKADIGILGWEPLILYPDGRKGHSARHMGTVSLEDLTCAEACEFCRCTIAQAQKEWDRDPEAAGGVLLFCIVFK